MALDQVEDIDRLAEREKARREGRELPPANEEAEMSFIDHLDAMRGHIIRSVIAIFIFAVLAFIFNGYIFDHIILGPTKDDFFTYRMLCKVATFINSPSLCFTDLPQDILYNRKMTGQFTIHVSSSLVAGVVVAFPYIFWEVWRFVKPALRRTEQGSVSITTFVVSVLFFLGVLFGYFIISPITYTFFLNYSVSDLVKNEFDLSSYIAIVTNMVLVCGLMFQLPVVAYFLGKIGLISPEALKDKQRHIIVLILFIAAIVTPPDAFSQMLVALPMFILFQISILVVRISYKKD